jgi:hypothetical protein
MDWGLQEYPVELLPENLMLHSLPSAASNVFLENLEVRPTGHTTADQGPPHCLRSATRTTDETEECLSL